MRVCASHGRPGACTLGPVQQEQGGNLMSELKSPVTAHPTSNPVSSPVPIPVFRKETKVKKVQTAEEKAVEQRIKRGADGKDVLGVRVKKLKDKKLRGRSGRGTTQREG